MSNRLILNREITDDHWLLIESGATVPATGDIIVPLALWLEQREQLTARSGRNAVWLAPGDEPGLLAADTATLPLIAVRFPQFADGRGYSTARLLRERYGFTGELRAIGYVLRDQLFYLERVGFNAFAIKEGKSIEDALKAFGDFSDAYQSSAKQPLPLYQRRLQGQVESGPATAGAP